MQKAPSSRFLYIASFFSIYVFWGATYLWNKIAIQELPPFMLAGFRFTLAGLLIFAIALAMRQSIRISKKHLFNATLAGIFFLTYGNGALVWALKYVDSGFAALEAASQPLIILLMMRVLYGTPIKTKSIIGIIFGLVGIYLLVGQDALLIEKDSLTAILVIFSCIISWSIGALFVARADMHENFFVNSGYQMFSAGILLMVVSLLLGETWSAPTDWTLGSLSAIFCLIFFGSILAYTAFNYLLKIVSPEKVATTTYINPIVALFLGWIVLDEKVTIQSGVAAVILLTGVYFINSGKREVETTS